MMNISRTLQMISFETQSKLYKYEMLKIRIHIQWQDKQKGQV